LGRTDLKQINYGPLEPFTIEDDAWTELQLRNLLTRNEIVISEPNFDELVKSLEDKLYKVKYLNREIDTVELLEATLTDLKFIKMGARS